MTPQRLILLSRWTCVAVLLAGCSTDSGSGSSRTDLGEFAAFQTAQVTSATIDSSSDQDPSLDFGWSTGRLPGVDEEVLTLVGQEALFRFFSSEASATTLQLDATWLGPPEPLRLGLMLNAKRMQAVQPLPGRQSYTIRIPAQALHQGWNVLRLQARSLPLVTSGEEARFGIHSLNWLAADGKSVRPGDVGSAILRSSAADPADAYVEMPNGSYFDVVARIGPDSHLRTSLRARLAPQATGSATVSITLEEDPGASRQLFSLTLGAADRVARDLDIPLELAAEGLARIRFQVSGQVEATVRWLDLHLQQPVATRSGQTVEVQPETARRSRPPRPDILLILLDAARADAFSVYGGPYSTPSLERLAADGTLFERAMAPSAWTGQSVPSILTGLGPDALGIGHWGDRIPPSVPTLAELLSDAGYESTLWSQHPFYGWHRDLHRGFSTVSVVGSGPFDDGAFTDHLMAAQQPHFGFLHLLPPHAPYTPPAPFSGSRTEGYEGGVEASINYLNRVSLGSEEPDFEDADLRYIKDRYLEHVEYADSLIGRVIDALDAEDRYDSTLIAVVSDHGEAFYEHQQFLHTRELYEEFVRVPFVVKWPAGFTAPGPEIAGPVSLLDLVPTLAEVLRLELSTALQGESLLGSRSDTVFTTTRGNSDRYRMPRNRISIESEGWKAIWEVHSDVTKLYHLTDDPGEKTDLASTYPVMAQFLRQEILRRYHTDRQTARVARGDQTAPTTELDLEAIGELEALGYLN